MNSKLKKQKYEIAGEIYNEIKDKKLYLHNPHKDEISRKYEERIKLKVNDYKTTKSKANKAYANASSLKEDAISVFFSDIFYEPNYNMENETKLYSETISTYKNCEKLYLANKFNSAIDCMNIVTERYESVSKVFDRENKIGPIF